MAFAMGGENLWALVLGFALYGIVQAVITKGEMSRLLPNNRRGRRLTFPHRIYTTEKAPSFQRSSFGAYLLNFGAPIKTGKE